MSEWPKGTVEERVIFALGEVRPALEADGGDVRLVSVEGNCVRLELIGACRTCPMAHSTLSDFVAERIRLYAPEITEVVASRS
ncbi:MAG: NifU family protein [Thermoanaerobaculales bacterium]|nr:NifU family protein [Thermoanaerobaculales bacterium]